MNFLDLTEDIFSSIFQAGLCFGLNNTVSFFTYKHSEINPLKRDLQFLRFLLIEYFLLTYLQKNFFSLFRKYFVLCENHPLATLGPML